MAYGNGLELYIDLVYTDLFPCQDSGTGCVNHTLTDT